MTYTVPKKVFTRDSEIENMEIHFLNGDFLTIRKNEICNISIEFYDMLMRHNEQLFSIARNGFVKLKIQNGKAKWERRSLYNATEYDLGRKKYIEERCVYNDTIKFIKLYDLNNWSDNIYGDIQAIMEGDYLFLRFKPHDTLGSWENSEHFVKLSHPSKNQIFKMRLDFENCDGIDVYNSEIIEIKLAFNKRLDWIGPGYVRSVSGGFIKIKFDNEYENRYFNIWNDGKKVKLKHLEQRICGNGYQKVDICNLYLEFYDHSELSGEHITIDSLYRTHESETFDNYDDFYAYYDSIEEDDDDHYCDDDNIFESGYAEKLDDGSIKIVFGKI